MTDKDMTELDVFFDAARRETETLSDTLHQKMLADALAVQESWKVAPVAEPRQGRLKQLFDVLGGWPSLGGLVTACAAGIWLGISPPQGLETFVQIDQIDSGLFYEDSLVLAMAEDG